MEHNLDPKSKLKLKAFSSPQKRNYWFNEFVRKGIYQKAYKSNRVLEYPGGVKTIFVCNDDLKRFAGMRFYAIEHCDYLE